MNYDFTHEEWLDENYRPLPHLDHPYEQEDPEVISMLEQAERESDG